jgi:DNA polymerase elongation subunit (family B)
VWAEPDGRVIVWRRVAGTLVREDVRFRPWLVAARAEAAHVAGCTVRELEGPGALRFLVRADDVHTLQRLRRELGEDVLLLAVEEQYLVASGRTYFKDLAFDDLRRMQLDLETTGLDADRDRIFLIALRDPAGKTEILEDDDEAALIARMLERIRVADPDVIENHNLHGFDLPFLERRARILRVPLALGRAGSPGLRVRPARRGVARDDDSERRVRFTVPGRELIDTMDAVGRHDFATRELPGHGLKAVARHFGLARDEREHVPGARIHEVYLEDPERVRRYAADDVAEVAGLARLLGGATFALATMAPRRYERLADAGPATGVIDPLLVRAYLHGGAALPAHQPGDGTQHDGAGLHLFATGVAHRIVKADVASLYPSLMRQYRIGPARDRLGVMLALVDRLVERRLAAKARGRAATDDADRFSNEAMSSAMKLLINSAYGYLAAGSLTRFADVHAANEVTRHGRALLDLLCRELRARGGTLLEADTDGVYFAAPTEWTEADERRVIGEVAALLPEHVHLEHDGRYAAMLSHEPKNYALLGYDGALTLRGVAFRSSRLEPFGDQFLRAALACLLRGDIVGVQRAYLAAVSALQRRATPTRDVTTRVRLTKTPQDYLASRESRRELSYEALLARGRSGWVTGTHVRVYRTARGGSGLVDEDEDPRDYDIDHYLRVLRDTFASRLVRALTPDDFATVFADPNQLSLFATSLAEAQPILTLLVE